MRGPIEGFQSRTQPLQTSFIPRYQMRGPIEGIVWVVVRLD